MVEMARATTLVAAAIILASFTFEGIDADKPCSPRMGNSTVYCVCNSTYCDEVDRVTVANGSYVCYTSSKAGLRLSKAEGTVAPVTDSTSLIAQLLLTIGLTGEVLLQVNTSKQYQKVEGFGGALTDSAAINWLSLSKSTQDQLKKSYFSTSGIEYLKVRVPIGGCDFSTHPYALNVTLNGTTLTSVTPSPEDYNYKMQILKYLLSATEIHIVLSTWSPPAFWKTNGALTGIGKLKAEFYQAYADYHLKAIEAYADMGLPVWAITSTNEPNNGITGIVQFNSLGWTPENLGKWLYENMCPTIRNSSYSDVKILIVDDQRYTLPTWVDTMVQKYPSLIDCIYGIAVHFYADAFVPPTLLSSTYAKYPTKPIINTEASAGANPWDSVKVILGSWSRGELYLKNIIQDFNYGVAGWIDWNLSLDTSGGPNWAGNNVDSPVIVSAGTDEFFKQPTFYAMAHFSKWVRPGAFRIDVQQSGSSTLKQVAFSDGDDVIVVIYNGELVARTVNIVVNNKGKVRRSVPASSFTTIVLKQ